MDNIREVKKLILIGASGFGREVAWLVERINAKELEWDVVGFLDDNPNLAHKIVNGYEVLGKIEDSFKYEDAYFACCVGSSKLRKEIIDKLKRLNSDISFATLIDPSVTMSKLVKIGDGSIICADTILTVNAYVGNHVIINLDCTIGHDAELKEFVTLYPSVNISGNVVIDGYTEIGTGTQIIQGKKVGSNTIIGAGSVVVSDINSNVTAVGVPCAPIEKS